MEMIFDSKDGRLIYTDYWIDPQGRESGRPWVAVRRESWHLLMEGALGSCPGPVVAMPVTANSEPEGWQWKIWLSNVCTIHVPLDCFIGPPPLLPPPRTRMERYLHLYNPWYPGVTDQRVPYGFGHFEDGAVPMIATCSLIVCRRGSSSILF